jgi:hypothetical protein
MNRTTWIAAIFCGLAVLVIVQSCTPHELTSGQVTQEADGCGAWRYRGSANVDCRYRGEMRYSLNSGSGTCVNDSQVRCTYEVRCEWILAERITECVSDAPDCMTAYPPEGSIANPDPVRTFDLPAGSTLCDPPGTAQQLASFCNEMQYPQIGEFRAFCEGQTDRNMGSTTCCLNCPQPNPLPGASLLGEDGGIGGMDGGIGGEDGGIGGGDGGIGGGDAGTPQCSGEDN